MTSTWGVETGRGNTVGSGINGGWVMIMGWDEIGWGVTWVWVWVVSDGLSLVLLVLWSSTTACGLISTAVSLLSYLTFSVYRVTTVIIGAD